MKRRGAKITVLPLRLSGFLPPYTWVLPYALGAVDG